MGSPVTLQRLVDRATNEELETIVRAILNRQRDTLVVLLQRPDGLNDEDVAILAALNVVIDYNTVGGCKK